MHQNYLKEFIHYTIFNIFSMLALSFYILVDTLFIARGIGPTGLAALNIAIPPFNLANGLGLMLGIGGAIKYTIYKAEQHQAAQDRVFTSIIWLWAVLSVTLMLLGLFAAGPITGFLGGDEETFVMARTYIRVTLLFAPGYMLNNILSIFIRNDGDPRLATIATSVGCISNVIFDYIFIFPMQMGLFGAVLATGFSPLFSIAIMSSYFIRRKHHFHLRRILPDIAQLGNCLALGVSSFINEMASGVVIIVFNLLILRLEGNMGVAAYGVITNMSLVVVAMFTGVAEGMQPLTSRCYGAKDSVNLKKILRYAFITSGIIAALIYFACFAFADPITSVFNPEHNALLQQLSVRGLKLYFLCAPFMGLNIVMMLYFSSTEKALPSQIISLLRGLILLIPMAICLAYLGGMTGVWLALPVTELLVLILAAILYKIYQRK